MTFLNSNSRKENYVRQYGGKGGQSYPHLALFFESLGSTNDNPGTIDTHCLNTERQWKKYWADCNKGKTLPSNISPYPTIYQSLPVVYVVHESEKKNPLLYSYWRALVGDIRWRERYELTINGHWWEWLASNGTAAREKRRSIDFLSVPLQNRTDWNRCLSCIYDHIKNTI